MSSPDPPDDPKKRGFRHSIRRSYHRVKDAFRRRSSSSQPSGHLTPLSPSSVSQSLSGHNTPRSTAVPLPTRSELATDTPQPVVQDSILSANLSPHSQEPTTESVSGRKTSALITGPLTIQSDRPTDAPPQPQPQPQISVSNDEVKADATTTDTAPQNAAWSRLARTLHTLESSVELFPPLQSAIGAVIGCLDIVQVAASNREDYEELVAELEAMVNVLARDAGELATEPGKGSIANISQCLKQRAATITQKRDRGTIRRVLEATQDQDDVMRQYRQIERLFRQLQATLLGRILPVDDVKYNSGYSTTVRRRGCTAETREAIHQALQDWTTDPESEKIYWMNGMAGTGKTTIAYSYCEWLESTNQLGGSFFCSRISSSCRSLNQIIPTLAHQLAFFSPAFRSKLCNALNDTPDAGKLNVMQQFEKLIYRPMLDSKDAIPDSIVVVIDALDECDDGFSVQLLLNVLLKFANQLPLKFFIASRPEHVIRERMVAQGGAARAIVQLHDIEESIVEEDIKKYLTEAFSSMSPPPTNEQIAMLAKRSRNLFIYAATLVRYIYPGNYHVDSAERLQLMLEAISDPRAASKNKYDDLDRLYTTVLSAVFHTGLDDSERDRMKYVLWTVVCAKEPMFVETIALLASLDERHVWAALQSLRSVIHVPETNSLISTLHASFPEYMLDATRSEGFFCNESECNGRLADRLFYVMRSELRFNICQLSNSYLDDIRVENFEARVAKHISPTLSYSCRYWSSHLSSSPATKNTHDILLDFLSNRLLFWMEVLSLCRSIGIGALMMQEAQAWLKRLVDTPDETQKQLSDARNFVTWFATNPCSRSTPHIYISALPLCAKSNWVYQHYSKRMKGLVNIDMSERDESALAIWSVNSPVYSLAMSPDGSRIAAGAKDGSIHLYDIHTGAVALGPLKAHTGIITSVSFSPDGALLASGSQDGTVVIWDTHTGRIVTGPLEHTDIVNTVAFSPGGKRLASGSDDNAVRIWDVSTGAIILGPLQGHSGVVCSVAFSPDGRHIASGSEDSTIRLWDTTTGAAVTDPFRGHSNMIWTVAFSPDGSKLASCSRDKTIRVWDMSTGTVIEQPLGGHEGPITSLAFSSDGTRLVCAGGYDAIASGGMRLLFPNRYAAKSIFVWDINTKSVALGPLHGHTDIIWSVVFSPDGTRVVSGSLDSRIRIWDVQRASRASDTQKSRETCAGPVALSPDGTRFISCSSSRALHIWDMRTGTIIPPTFEGSQDLGPITSVAYSPDGQHVAAAASDLAFYVWNILKGAMISQPFTGHTASIRCLAFSPDGASVCSGSDDSTIIVWNIQSGTMIGQPYEGHTGSVHSITYSPDGTHVASGADDDTVRVWDPATGNLVHTLSGHRGSVESVAYSPDGRYIISGSADKYIRKWDLEAPSKAVEYDCGYPVGSVAFSPDGTQVIARYHRGICMFYPQISVSTAGPPLPYGETVRWVGFLPESNDIISVSTSTETSTRRSTDDTSKQPSEQPNIIRVWRVGFSLDQDYFPSETSYWSLERDGRILSPEGLVAWVPPDLLPYLGRNSYSDIYYNPFVLSSKGVIDLGYKDLCIGERWTECYVNKG